MSVLYLFINSIDSNGAITDYGVHEVFEDFDEMLNWFAYDINPNVQINKGKLYEYNKPYFASLCSSRLHALLSNQNLCGLDTLDDVYLRNRVLYDTKNHSFIDIRNYLEDIKSHVCSSIRFTEYSSNNVKNTKQGRTHHRDYYGNRILSFYKHKLIANEPLIDLEDVNQYINISMHFYSPNDFWDHIGCSENNWKSKKIRKQWQYHENVSCKKHYRNKSKYCDDSWIYDEDDKKLNL